MFSYIPVPVSLFICHVCFIVFFYFLNGILCHISLFLSRVACYVHFLLRCMQCRRGLAMRILSVRLSVRLYQAHKL